MPRNDYKQRRPVGRLPAARAVVPLVLSCLLLSGCLTTTGGLDDRDGGADVSSLQTARPAEKLDPDYRKLLLAHGQRALEAGKFEEASSAYKRVLDAEPNNVEAIFGMAETMLATGNNPGALSHYRAIKQDESYRARALQGEGIVLLRLGQQQSSELLRESVALDPTLWRSWNALGRTLDLQNKHDEAREAYDRALALEPDSAVILNNRGVSNMLAGRFAEAESDLRQAAASDREMKRTRANLRLALAWQGKYAEALTGVSRVDAPVALNNIGYIAMKRGDLGHAEAYFAQAMQLSPAFYDKADRNLKYLNDLKKLNGPVTAAKS